MRVTSKGQVTIPKAIREAAGIQPGSEVDFAVDEGIVTVRRSSAQPTPGEELVEQLRSGREHFSMSTEEIMALTRGES